MVISTCSLGTVRSTLLSPACGPAPVTSVPVTSTAASATPLRKVNWRNGFGTRRTGTTVVGLADLDVEQHGQPHHRHRRQQVDGDRPPQQPGQHRDAADHGLHHRRRRHQPRVDQHLAAAPGPGDGQHRERGRQHHEEGDHPVAELDNLVHDGHLGDRDRGEAAGEALRPGRAAQAGGGDADDRAGDGDAALGQDDRNAMTRWARRLGMGSRSTSRRKNRPTGTARS